MRISVGITGASGAIYADRLVSFLVKNVDRVYLTLTPTAEKVLAHEISDKESILLRSLNGQLNSEEKGVLRLFKSNDYFAPIASGSSVPDAMIIAPCSVGSMSRIANSISSNLLERAADVCLKQRRPLILGLRETPLHTIHLQNMLKLSEAGAIVAPLMPGFYHKPESIDELADFMVGRLLELIGVDHELYKRWNARMI
ncbi:MAG: flavin prenyltransferase UbiX [Pseudomonadota bacterium]